MDPSNKARKDPSDNADLDFQAVGPASFAYYAAQGRGAVGNKTQHHYTYEKKKTEIFILECWRDREIWVRGRSRLCYSVVEWMQIISYDSIRARIVWSWPTISLHTSQHDNIVALIWHNSIVGLRHCDPETHQLHVYKVLKIIWVDLCANIK